MNATGLDWNPAHVALEAGMTDIAREISGTAHNETCYAAVGPRWVHVKKDRHAQKHVMVPIERVKYIRWVDD